MTGKIFRNKVLITCLVLLTAVSSTACGSENTAVAEGSSTSSSRSPSELLSYGDKDEETLMVYMVGSDLESQGGAATADLQEIVESGYDADQMNIIVCAGGASHWWNSSVGSESPGIYEVKNGDLNLVKSTDSRNMGEPDTVTEFIDYAYENYPAKHYGLIFWDHGGGAVLGYGADEVYNYDSLSVPDLKSSIEDSELAADTKFDFIGFDACLMGMIEVADALKGCADYLIASEETESGYGWDYSFLKDVTDNGAYGGGDLADYVIDTFSEFYDSSSTYVPDYSLSCIDLSKTDEIVSSLDTLVTAADQSLRGGNYSRIARCRDSAKAFGMISQYEFYDYIDLYSLASSMKSEFPEESDALRKSIDDAVVKNGSNISGAHGLSIYFPYTNKEYADQWVAAYEQNGFSSTYTSFIKDFTQTLEGDALWQGSYSGLTPEQGSTSSEYFVQLSDEQTANFAHAYASIWQPDDEDTYICWLNSQDLTLSDDGKLSSQFDGKIFYLVDGSGESHPCCAVEIDRTDEYTKFAIPVFINLGMSDSTNAYIHVKTDAEHPEGYICGIYKQLDTDSELYPDKNIIELDQNDEITPFLFARDIVFNDDQTVAPFDQWKSSSGAGSPFTVGSELQVRLQKNETQDDYICLFYVTDTQGNQYYTNYLNMSYDSFS